jgi:L-ascorbate metabolism protein UlaG (beta-lactamase superfamily)
MSEVRLPQHILTLPALSPEREQQLNISQGEARGSVFFVGNATVIIQLAGFTVMTDPTFLHAGDHAHLGFGLTTKRLTNPAIEIEQLPPIDLIVLSHMHEDHFDRVVQEKLDKRIPIVTTPHAASSLKKKGFVRLYPLDTWEKMLIGRQNLPHTIMITSMPGKHAPHVLSALHVLPPVMGTLLEFHIRGQQQGPSQTSSQGRVEPKTYRIYISGDTLVHDALKEIPRQYPWIDLGLFHLGGTTVLGLVVTMNAKQGVEAIRIIKPHVSIPIHYNDYDRFKSTLEDFKQEVRDTNLQERVVYLSHGETYEFAVPMV